MLELTRERYSESDGRWGIPVWPRLRLPHCCGVASTAVNASPPRLEPRPLSRRMVAQVRRFCPIVIMIGGLGFGVAGVDNLSAKGGALSP